jgi:hypothetical protein
VRTTHDRRTAGRAARHERPATAQQAPLQLDSAGLIALQRAVGNAATGALLARFRRPARRPDEAKIRARAYELYERSGGGVRSREEDERYYFEAQRQVEIEERAHRIWELRGGDPVANYYDAERQIAEQRTRRQPVEATTTSVEMDAAWEQLKAQPGVVYRTPPLTEADARAVVADVEREAPNALQGLQQQEQAFLPGGRQADRRHEWGILKAKTRADECMLIVGDATGVNWGTLLHSGIAIAHSHPYFKQGPARHPPLLRRGEKTGKVSTETKEIADHQIGDRREQGAVLWSDLASRKEGNEMLKIFPSASDIAFSAKKGVTRHSVYTTYLVLVDPAGTKIANPDFNKGEWTETPRLSFEIRDAEHVQGGDYKCKMAAFADDVEFWTHEVVTQGDGPLSPIRWS